MNNLRYEQISIDEIDLSVRSYNALKRAGIETLAELVTAYEHGTLLDIRNLGVKSYEDIKETIEEIGGSGFQLVEDYGEEESFEQYVIPEAIENVSVYDLDISTRLRNGLVHSGFDTVGKILKMTRADMNSVRGMGAKTADELRTIIHEINEEGFGYFADDRVKCTPVDERNKRTIDAETVKRLKEGYGFKPGWLTEWYNVTRSRIQQILNKGRNRGNWLNREMNASDEGLLLNMIEKKVESIESDKGIKAYFLSNGTGDCAAIFVSDDEIKCFFLNMMPEYIQTKIKESRLDCLSMEELEIISSGKIVSILKQEYFCPENTGNFRQFASKRGMSTEEYCKFLTEMEYVTAQSTVNDEKIVAFLNAYSINGRLMIPSNKDTLWFRSFISRHGYSIKDIADLYGFAEQQMEGDVQRFCSVEEDMQPYEIDSKIPVEKTFAENPLLGNEILSEECKENLYTITKRYIDERLRDPRKEFPLREKMEITLAVITYAKEWDSKDETGFWKYITTQFGYRDEMNQLREILCDCVWEASVKNHRWFISNEKKCQYKSTIVAHALTTRRSWMLMYDFLFDFYKTNMKWTYIEDDPIIERMVTALRSKLIAGDEANDDQLEISTKVYSFQEGIRKLIIYRTGYAIKLICHMLRRIDGIINHTEMPAQLYVDVLCDQWFESKLKRAREDRKYEPSVSVVRSVAIDYTRIRPAYILQNETDVIILFPDIRLKKTEFEKVELLVYTGGVNVDIRSLSYYGNELGKTLHGFHVDVNKCLQRGDGTLHIRIVLSCDDEEIYDSGDTLYREYLCFSNSKECDVRDCEKGAYSFFTTECNALDFIGSEVSDIDAGSRWKSYFVRLGENFVVKYDDQIIVFDRSDGSPDSGIRVIHPASDAGVVFTKKGHKYCVVTKATGILLILDDKEKLRKYVVSMNATRLGLGDIVPEVSGTSFIYTIPLQTVEDQTCNFQIVDLEKNRIISRFSVKVIQGFSINFNRDFYFSSEDFEGAYVNVVSLHGSKRYEINSSDEEISFPYDDGMVELKIPRVYVRNNEGQEWNRGYTAWIKQIKQNEKIYIATPKDCSCNMKLGTVDITEEAKGCFDYGNAVFAYSGGVDPTWTDLILTISKDREIQEYNIGRISTTERFVGEVRFDYHDHTLFWNKGMGFIGNPNGRVELRIETVEGSKEYPLNLNDEVVISAPELSLDEYKFSIVKESENIFLGNETLLYEGTLFIGDKNEIRFNNSMIEITHITYEKGSNLRSVDIQNTYIDQISFQGIQFVDSENRECPVYRGIMFFMRDSMKHHEFSFAERTLETGVQLYKINPVKIIFIGDHTLSITNEDGEGLYYYRYFDKLARKNHYAVTDREPTNHNQSVYSLADLYTYRKKRVE